MYTIDYDSMRIYVQQKWGRRSIKESLEVNPTDTIRDIKPNILMKLQIRRPIDDLILLYNKQPLWNSCTLLHYKISKGATLDIRLRLKG